MCDAWPDLQKCDRDSAANRIDSDALQRLDDISIDRNRQNASDATPEASSDAWTGPESPCWAVGPSWRSRRFPRTETPYVSGNLVLAFLHQVDRFHRQQ